MLGSSSTQRVFEGFYIFALPPSASVEPKLVYEFPPDPDRKDPLGVKALAALCFPYGDESAASMTSQRFTILYQASGLHGFCRQNGPLTPADDAECMCLVARPGWHSFYPKLLDWLYRVRTSKQGRDRFESVLEALGQERTLEERLVVPLDGIDAIPGFDEAIPVSHLQQLPRLKDTPAVALLCKSLSTTNLLTIFASLLLERRILITSKTLANITGVIHGILDLMFPLSWAHVCIPIMSKDLLDYCYCPAPFIMGVHSSLVEIVRSGPIESHLFVDVDNDSVIGEDAADDYRSIPLEELGLLRSAINKARDGQTPGTELFQTFMRFFAVLLGSYKEHLLDSDTDTELGKGGKIKSSRFIFDEESFLAARPKGYREFVGKLLKFQAGDLFIQSRLLKAENPDEEDDVFEQEQRALEASPKYKWAHRDEVTSRSTTPELKTQDAESIRLRPGKQVLRSRPVTVHSSTEASRPFIPVAPPRKKKGTKATLQQPSTKQKILSNNAPSRPARPARAPRTKTSASKGKSPVIAEYEHTKTLIASQSISALGDSSLITSSPISADDGRSVVEASASIDKNTNSSSLLSNPLASDPVNPFGISQKVANPQPVTSNPFASPSSGHSSPSNDPTNNPFADTNMNSIAEVPKRLASENGKNPFAKPITKGRRKSVSNPFD